MAAPQLRHCPEPDCFALPVPSCFAQDPAWKFSTTVRKTLREHVQLHYKFRDSKHKLVALAKKVRRTDQGTFSCACGFEGNLSRLLKHHCRDVGEGKVIKSVAKNAAKATKSPRKTRMRRRTAASFAKALPRAAGSDEFVIKVNPEENESVQEMMDACLAAQQNLGAPFLRLLSPASRAGRVKALRRRPTALHVGDFVRRPASNSFWCIKKMHLKDRMKVLEFVPCKCKVHTGGCWRILRKQGKPACVSIRRAKLLRGGPLLYPRIDKKSPPLAKRCFAQEDWPRQPAQSPPSRLEAFLQDPEPAQGKHNAITRQIFESLAVMTLQYTEIPESEEDR